MEHLFSIIVCPVCTNSLEKTNKEEFKCSNCNKKYRIKNDILILIKNDTYYNN